MSQSLRQRRELDLIIRPHIPQPPYMDGSPMWHDDCAVCDAMKREQAVPDSARQQCAARLRRSMGAALLRARSFLRSITRRCVVSRSHEGRTGR